MNDMGKVTEDAIKIKLINEIRDNWRELEWQGIDLDSIQDLERVEPTLCADFRYEGSGEEYKFSAKVYFMIKVNAEQNGMNRRVYTIFPYSKMLIEEIGNDFNVKITTPIPLCKFQ